MECPEGTGTVTLPVVPSVRPVVVLSTLMAVTAAPPEVMMTFASRYDVFCWDTVVAGTDGGDPQMPGPSRSLMTRTLAPPLMVGDDTSNAAQWISPVSALLPSSMSRVWMTSESSRPILMGNWPLEFMAMVVLVASTDA